MEQAPPPRVYRRIAPRIDGPQPPPQAQLGIGLQPPPQVPLVVPPRRQQPRASRPHPYARQCHSCGGADHERMTSRRCPNYRPRLALRNVPAEGQDRRVVATGLRGILSSDALLPAIEDAVCRMTGIVSEATRFANGFLIHQHESGAAVPNLGCRSAGAIGYDFFRSVTGQSVQDAEVELFRTTIYATTRPATLPWCDGRSISRLMVNAATLFATNCRNHWATHIKSELRHWFEYKMDKALGDTLTQRDQDVLVEYAMDDLLAEGVDVTVRDLPLFPRDLHTLNNEQQRQWARVVERLHHYMHRARTKILDLRDGLTLPAMLDNSEEWWRYTRPLYLILKRFVKNFDRVNEQLRQRLGQDRANRQRLRRRRVEPVDGGVVAPAVQQLQPYQRRRGMRLFSLLPVAGFIPQHIQIDTAALRQLLRTGVLGQVYVPGDQSVFFRDADDWWRRAFNVDKCTSANRRFAYYISTNGVKASVHVSVTRRPRPAVNDYGYTFTQPSDYVRLPVDNNTRVVGLDPGRGNLFVANWGPDSRLLAAGQQQQQQQQVLGNTSPDDPHRTTVRVSNARWQDMFGNAKSTWLQRRWKRTLQSTADGQRISQLISAMPTPCCATIADYILHWRYFLTHRDEMLGVYRPKKHRRLRWKNYQTRQRAYNQLARMLHRDGKIGKDATTVIAYGGAPFPHASPGYAPTPGVGMYRELSHRLTVRKAPEKRTSKLCSGCDHELHQSKFCWFVKHCTNNNCMITWNRDVNAARNIRYMWLYMNEHNGERPIPFR